MKWIEKEPDIKATPLSRGLEGLSVLSAIEVLSSSMHCPYIFMPDKVKQSVMSHILKNKTESGGLLLGEVISTGDLKHGIVGLKITVAIPCSDFDATSVSLSMGPEVWSSARVHSNESNFVVGWYHSHPNLGAFFSGIDRKTQAEFFNQEYHVGLVIDPIRDEECWFLGKDSKPVPETYILEAKSRLALV
jgi:proteasome lid subunit RPN8/RPN11